MPKKSLEIFSFFETVDELDRAADQVSNKAPIEYRHSTYLYFIARYFVAVYEASFGEIPIQVWNEYRNALDHFFRYLTLKDNGQIKKMEGHIQRAVLDITKLFCHRSSESLDKILDKENYLRTLDDGLFYVDILKKKAEAKDLYIYAKINNDKLGEHSETDKEVIRRYLEPCFKYIYIEKIINNRRTNL